MPEEEVVKPDKDLSLMKSLMVGVSEKHKACLNCAKILEPQQDAIRSVKGKKADAAPAAAAAKSIPEPYYSVTVHEAKDLKSSQPGAIFFQLSVGSAILNTATAAPTMPQWGGTALDFPVATAAGNTLKVQCYREAGSGNELLGEASLPLAESGSTWTRLTPAGEVRLTIAFVGPKAVSAVPALSTLSAAAVSSNGSSQKLMAAAAAPAAKVASSAASSAAAAAAKAKAAVAPAPAAPAGAKGALAYLQEHAWAIYVVFLLSVIVYKFVVATGSFSGERIALRPGTTIGNDKWLSSTTHFLHMQKDGNLVLSAGTSPKDRLAVEWESGRPFADRDCPKCVAVMDKDGTYLHLKEGKRTIVSFNVPDDALLTAALGTAKPPQP
ncbi:unnamed protein product [Phaeothamnion confervicola]